MEQRGVRQQADVVLDLRADEAADSGHREDAQRFIETHPRDVEERDVPRVECNDALDDHLRPMEDARLLVGRECDLRRGFDRVETIVFERQLELECDTISDRVLDLRRDLRRGVVIAREWSNRENVDLQLSLLGAETTYQVEDHRFRDLDRAGRCAAPDECGPQQADCPPTPVRHSMTPIATSPPITIRPTPMSAWNAPPNQKEPGLSSRE